MAKSLLINPPFSKEEWVGVTIRELTKSPWRERISAYLAQYDRAMHLQGNGRMKALLQSATRESAGTQKVTHSWVRAKLDGALAPRDDCGTHYLEELLVLNSFLRFVKQQQFVRLDADAKWKMQQCEQLVPPILMVAINHHFGLLAPEEVAAMT